MNEGEAPQEQRSGGHHAGQRRETVALTLPPRRLSSWLAFSTVLPAAAHHSHAMFDLTVQQTIEGSVKSFAFQNPHVFCRRPDKQTGKSTTYVIQMSRVQNMISHGITAASFKPGDSMMIKINPMHGGRPGAQYITVSKDGKEYGRGAGE